MSAPTILVVTNEQDVGADFLVRELLSRKVRVVRLNAERAPEWSMTTSATGEWTARRGDHTITSEECVGVWWRRPELPQFEHEAADAIDDQWRAFLTSFAYTEGPVWVSAPQAIRRAENKLLQLRQARAFGLRVPDTLWTNDIEEAREFIDRLGGSVVAKSVASAWWEANDQGHFVFASLISSGELPTPQRLAGAPICFQQPIWPKDDVRVTVVGDTAYAAIRSRAVGEPLDWRLATNTPWTPYELPADVADACVKIVREFDLRFGGLDLARCDQGEYWFLELNPNGEWGWLQRAGLPIAEALANLLQG